MKKEQINEYLSNINNQMAIIFNVPNNSYHITINAKIIDGDGEMHVAESVMTLPEIIDARIAGDEWERENVKYVLTDKGRKEVEGK